MHLLHWAFEQLQDLNGSGAPIQLHLSQTRVANQVLLLIYKLWHSKPENPSKGREEANTLLF